MILSEVAEFRKRVSKSVHNYVNFQLGLGFIANFIEREIDKGPVTSDTCYSTSDARLLRFIDAAQVNVCWLYAEQAKQVR